MRIQPRDREPFAVMLAGVRDPDTHERAARLRWTLRDVSQTRAAQEALRSSEERLRHSQRLEAVGRLAGAVLMGYASVVAGRLQPVMPAECRLGLGLVLAIREIAVGGREAIDAMFTGHAAELPRAPPEDLPSGP